MYTITYRGKKYPVREITTSYGKRLISVESLDIAMNYGENEDSGDIDQMIYYFVPDRVIKLSEKVLLKKYIDD